MNNSTCYIVTLFNSFNPGAFLQGFALGRCLEARYGLDVSFVDTGARSVQRATRGECRSAIKHLALVRYLFSSRKGKAFEACVQNLNVVLPEECHAGALYVFGSDEIWNVARTEITRYPMLWGEGLPEGLWASYAPSANGAAPETFRQFGQFAENVAKYKFLSARDEPTASAAGEVLGKNVEVVCDPTLLHDVDFYREFEEEPDFGRYLLVYSYGSNMTEEDVAEIHAFAKAEGLKVVSACNRLRWADVNVPCGSFGFLGLVSGAEYVVTDTFHGSVFASIYGKRFASYGGHSPKVQSYLGSYGLDSRCVVTGGLSATLHTEQDWTLHEAALAAAKQKSLTYLDAVVQSYGGAR